MKKMIESEAEEYALLQRNKYVVLLRSKKKVRGVCLSVLVFVSVFFWRSWGRAFGDSSFYCC
ncbi:hypothetical protein RHGRI_003887 [Rhododendron griersonianum]|uniref:Uncharacterized protein n=1 Tax=Rhododendron griersonianum TaxID=479676 RepID=A0AAV6L7K8_9ERIC|nr:hypothetical protein RHGRI_003887 [Rhododendron griersonianum]